MGGFHYAHDYDTARAGKRRLNPPPPPPSARQHALRSEAPGETRTETHDDAHTHADHADNGMLMKLGGVRACDTSERAASSPVVQSRPRIACTPRQAATIILMLVAALCASLTLLIRQSVNLTRIEEATVSSSTAALPSSSSPTSGTAPLASPTSPDAQHSEASPPAAQEGGEPDITASATPPGQQDDGRIDINTADAAQLQRMNGVGPVTAQRIIVYRAEHGPYTSVDDLLNVKGIGAKTLEKIRSQAVAR